MKSSSIRTTLKNARGLGAAHEGTHHFWVQRMTALALIPLSVWFLIELVSIMQNSNRNNILTWFRDPIFALLTGIFLVALFWHARLGIQTIIEDYMHCEVRKIAVLVIVNGLNILLCAASLLAVVRLHFTGM